MTWLVITIASFWIIAALTTNDDFIQVIRAMQIALSAGVLMAVLPLAWQALWTKEPDQVLRLALGLAMLFTYVAMEGLWFLLWRVAGKPNWMLETNVHGFALWLLTASIVSFITTPGATGHFIPSRNWVALSLGIAAGLFGAGLLMLFPPDLSDWAHTLRPWLGDDHP